MISMWILLLFLLQYARKWGGGVFQLFHMIRVCQIDMPRLNCCTGCGQVLHQRASQGFPNLSYILLYLVLLLWSSLLCKQSDRQTNWAFYDIDSLLWITCSVWSGLQKESFLILSCSISSNLQSIVPLLYRSNGAIHKMLVTRSTGLIEHLTSETTPTLSSPVIMEVNLDFSVSLQPTHMVFSPDDSFPAPHH